MTTTATRTVIAAISLDSHVSDDAWGIAAALDNLYGARRDHLVATIDEMLTDDSWSDDRGPYEWLAEIRRHLV